MGYIINLGFQNFSEEALPIYLKCEIVDDKLKTLTIRSFSEDKDRILHIVVPE